MACWHLGYDRAYGNIFFTAGDPNQRAENMKQPEPAVGNAATLRATATRPGIMAKLVRLFRQRGLAGTLAHLHAVLLIRAHKILFDRRLDALEQVKSDGYLPLDSLRIDSVNRPLDNADIHYLPTPLLVLRWVLDLLPHSYESTTFADFGSGRGRVLLCAAQYPFAKVTGVEFAAELHEAATINLAALDSALIKCRLIENRLGDAADFPIPDGDAVLFFFNPFDARLMAHIRDRIAAAHRANPRPITVVYVNPKKRQVFDEDPSFEPLALPLGAALKFAALSPFQVALFHVVTR